MKKKLATLKKEGRNEENHDEEWMNFFSCDCYASSANADIISNEMKSSRIFSTSWTTANMTCEKEGEWEIFLNEIAQLEIINKKF